VEYTTVGTLTVISCVYTGVTEYSAVVLNKSTECKSVVAIGRCTVALSELLGGGESDALLSSELLQALMVAAAAPPKVSRTTFCCVGLDTQPVDVGQRS